MAKSKIPRDIDELIAGAYHVADLGVDFTAGLPDCDPDVYQQQVDHLTYQAERNLLKATINEIADGDAQPSHDSLAEPVPWEATGGCHDAGSVAFPLKVLELGICPRGDGRTPCPSACLKKRITNLCEQVERTTLQNSRLTQLVGSMTTLAKESTKIVGIRRAFLEAEQRFNALKARSFAPTTAEERRQQAAIYHQHERLYVNSKRAFDMTWDQFKDEVDAYTAARKLAIDAAKDKGRHVGDEYNPLAAFDFPDDWDV